MKELILASASPRRRQMLADLGVLFRVMVSDADETCTEQEPVAFALEVSKRKALAVTEMAPENTIVIACDTVVAYGDRILGKPVDRADAKRMLQMLSGNEHRVVSALCVSDGEKTVQKAVSTVVRFRKIEEEELEAYLLVGESDDKAGAYGIQGLGGLFVEEIRGDWYTVVGMPLQELFSILKNEFSIDFYTLRQTAKGGTQ